MILMFLFSCSYLTALALYNEAMSTTTTIFPKCRCISFKNPTNVDVSNLS